MSHQNPGAFNNHVFRMQGCGFPTTTALPSTMHESPVNRSKGRAEVSNELHQSPCSADGYRSRDNGSCSTARNAVHIAKLFASKEKITVAMTMKATMN